MSPSPAGRAAAWVGWLAFAWTTPAQAAKVDQVERWIADGKCAEVVQKIDEWEDKSALGAEDYDLRRLRAQAGLCVARGADTLDDWRAFVKRFGDWPEATEARTRLYDLALSAAQLEGSASAMRAYIAEFPDSPHLAQARAQEEAWAFEDAAKSGDPNAIHAFLAAHPDTTMREQAWEALVQTKEGIYLISAGGEPQRIEPIAIGENNTVDIPAGLAMSGSVPTIGVNQAGAGRGETSEWWRLEAIVFDSVGAAHLTDIAPLAAVLAERLGLSTPPPSAGLLELIRAPGAHLARVATTRNPLTSATWCTGFTRYALTLRSPGTPPVAWPFAADCPNEDESASPLGLLLSAIVAAEAGNRALAGQRWDTLLNRPEAEGLVAWMKAALGEDAARAAVVDRPGVGDWVVWTRQGTGPAATPTATWLRMDGERVVVAATRPGWAVSGDKGLVVSTNDPRCAEPLGSVGTTLFCSLGTSPAPVGLQGDALGWGMPAPETLTAAGLPADLGLESVIAVAPRWQGGLRAAWTVKKGKGTVELVGEAPAAWTRAVAVPPPVAAWLDTNAGGAVLGLSPVTAEAWAAWQAFAR